MKIKELNINNSEECKKWENFVYINGYLYQSYKWIKVLKESYNIESLYLYLEDNKNIISTLPLFHVKFPFLINELVSIPHLEAGGIINPQYYQYFLDYICENYKVKNVKIYQFKDEIDNLPKNDINSLFMIDIPDDLESVFKYLKKGIKRSVKNLLEKTDIKVEKGNSKEFIDFLYYFNIIKSKEFGVPHHSYRFFQVLIESFKDNCEVFVAKKDGKPIGASFVIYFNKIAYHIYHFVPEEFLKIKAGLVLYANIFINSFKKEMKIFSFGRSPKGSGPYKFKTQMKAKPYSLNIYNFTLKNNHIKPEKVKIVSEKYSWATNIWKVLPSNLTNYISPKLRKWIY